MPLQTVATQFAAGMGVCWDWLIKQGVHAAHFWKVPSNSWYRSSRPCGVVIGWHARQAREREGEIVDVVVDHKWGDYGYSHRKPA